MADSSACVVCLCLALGAGDKPPREPLGLNHLYGASRFTRWESGASWASRRPKLKALQAAAILHDIGKLAIPEAIISKPGKLTPEEFKIMKIHPIGAEIVELMEFPCAAAPLVRAHLEKWNGTEIPDGLEGEQIPQAPESSPPSMSGRPGF